LLKRRVLKLGARNREDFVLACLRRS
jgi:hypothetical protein